MIQIDLRVLSRAIGISEVLDTQSDVNYAVKLNKVTLQNRYRSEVFDSGLCIFETFNLQRGC